MIPVLFNSNRYTRYCPVFLAVVLCLASITAAQAPAPNDPTVPPEALREFMTNTDKNQSKSPRGLVEIEVGENGRISRAQFVNAPLVRVAEAIGEHLNANIVVSSVVADRTVTLTIRNINLENALQAIAVSQGLVSRKDRDSELYILASPEDVRRDVSALRSNRTEVFTLLYPNATDVVRTIGEVFGDRVVVAEDDNTIDETLDDLEDRFKRFDLIEERSRGLIGSIGGTNVRSTSSSTESSRRDRQRFSRDNNIARPRRLQADEDLPELTADEAQRVIEAMRGDRDAENVARRIANRNALTYVTAIQRLNKIVVRSGDPKILEEIASVIRRLDVPTPLVLLEVRVLRVDLSDGLETGFDFAFQSGDLSGAFSQGEIGAPSGGSLLPGGTGVSASAGIFQVVSSNFAARLELLQTKGRVTSLATPILLTANNEVSRIFSGEQIPIVVGFTEPQVITGEGATTTLASTPVTELRDVGTDLLITANINADRTVTLRLLQETSTVNEDGATILVPTGTSFINESIDTVASQSASGTIVARDGMLLAFGGLIEETETDTRQQLPILGDLPLVGFLFRRESSEIRRSELVVLVRPYVMNTPVEGDAISRNLLDSLSIHPYRPGEGGSEGTKDDWGVFRDEAPSFERSLFDTFRYHTAPSLHGNTGNE